MDQRLRDGTEGRSREELPAGETSVGVAYGVALVVPMLLCCLLPLLLAAGIGTVVGAAGSWLAGFGGVEIAAGAVVAGAAGYGLVRWRRARLRRGDELAACELPNRLCAFAAGPEALSPERDEPAPPRAAPARAAALEGASNRD